MVLVSQGDFERYNCVTDCYKDKPCHVLISDFAENWVGMCHSAPLALLLRDIFPLVGFFLGTVVVFV